MPSVLVVGSSNTDMVISSDRIPVPGETILGGTFAIIPGGKGANQAVSAARLGADVTFVARIGTDIFGDEALKQYATDHIDLQYVVRDKSAPSGIAMIMVDRSGENAISVASGANMKLTSSDVALAHSALVSTDMVVLQLEIPYETVAFTANLASEHQVPVILNPAPACPLDDSLLRQVDYLTPNEVEAASLTGIEVVDDASANRAAHCLLDRGVGTVIITMGDRGSYWAT
ncbi:MAG: ribokinase, partial [Candidatus Latescibacteria bacterium]|nr:ribokinase [Candidatus Latescibacterota bacterium]